MTKPPPHPVDTLALFADLSRHERDLVKRLSSATDLPGATELCRQGGLGQTFFVLIEGEATVTVDGDVRAVLGPGCGFGEIALLRTGGRRAATVTTTSASRVLVFSRPEFATLMREIPRFARAALAECRRRLADHGRGGLSVTS